MIVIKIEMWPEGNETKSYPLGRMYIWNKVMTTLSNPRRGDYEFCIMRKDRLGMINRKEFSTATGEVKDWPRLSYSVWKLVLKCLEIAFSK